MLQFRMLLERLENTLKRELGIPYERDSFRSSEKVILPARRHSGLFILQVHITERCNLRCSHCYQNDQPGTEMSESEILDIVNQFALLCSSRDLLGQVTLTGGEPLVREELFNIGEKISSGYPALRIAILTNGTLITGESAKRLKRFHPVFVQVSIDGGSKTHDSIRGAGSFERALLGMDHLFQNSVPCQVAFTAQRDNYREFPLVVEAAKNHHARRVWTDRLVPIGRGGDFATLTPIESREFFELVRKEQQRCEQDVPALTHVAMARSLQFLSNRGTPHRCQAGRSLLAIMPDGLAYPCRRLPIPVGNLRTSRLSEIVHSAQEVLGGANSCPTCEHTNTCRGGAKCLTYAVSGNLSSPDPGCWLA